MKEVFTAPNVIPCDLLKAVLEANGITGFIKNEQGSTMVGIGYPLPSYSGISFAWPEVWVQDEDFQHAGEIVTECQNEKSEFNALRSFHRDASRKHPIVLKDRNVTLTARREYPCRP